MNEKRAIATALITAAAIYVIAVPGPRILLDAPVARLATTQGLELGLSLAAIAWLGRGRFADYGFRRPAGRATSGIGAGAWILAGMAALALGAVASIAMLASGGQGNPVMKALSFPQIMLFVWILSSTIEEVFTRGFLQSHLAKAWGGSVRVPVLGVDRPTLASAAFFACMHLVLIAGGADAPTVIVILLFTFSVGLLAGHLRARTGSLLPAIGAHMLANVGGVIGGILFAIVTVLTGGELPQM